MVNNSPIIPTTPKKAREKLEQEQNIANKAGHSSGVLYHATTHGTVYYSPRVKAKRSQPASSSYNAQLFKIQDVKSDWLICRTWDGETTGSVDIEVLKNAKLRCSISSSVVAEQNHVYTYFTAFEVQGTEGNVMRKDDIGSFTEYQTVIPYWDYPADPGDAGGEEIMAVYVENTGYTSSLYPSQSIHWYYTAPSRQWAHITESLYNNS